MLSCNTVNLLGTDLIPLPRVPFFLLIINEKARVTRFSCIRKKTVTGTIIVTISDNNRLELPFIVLFYGQDRLKIFLHS